VQTDCILVRYGEIALKSRATRKNFEKILRNNIKKALKINNISFDLITMQGRILVESEDIKKAVDVISHVFGITSISPAFKLDTDLIQISGLTFSLIDKHINKGQSFALRVTRTGNHPFSSQDVAINVGSFVQKQKDFTVDLTNPDIEVFIEIRDNQSYLFLEKISGPGGMPRGSQGRMVSIIDSAYDLLASWYLLKRGCDMLYIYSDEKILNDADTFFSTWHIPRHVFYCGKNDDFWDQVSMIISNKQCQAICSGIHFSQNRNEDISLIKSLKQQVSIPVLTPLISFGSEELQKLCKEKRIKT